VAGEGHFVLWTRPELIARAVRGSVAGLSVASSGEGAR